MKNGLRIVRRHQTADTAPPPFALSPVAAFALIFTAVWLLHAPLLRLPYFWDEAGYYVPAARDLLLHQQLIPTSTLTNAHPPLVMGWLALWWKLSGYTAAVTRTAMLLIAAFTLLGVFRLARQVANLEVAIGSTVLTALFPVFFAQSSLAHLDMTAAGFTLWALAAYLRHHRIRTVILFAMAALAKETAIIAPLALLGWELLGPLLAWRNGSYRDICIYPRRDWRRSLALLGALLPLVAWFAFHYARTGHVFGNPEFVRYNVVSTAHPVRIMLAALERLWQLLLYLNMFVLTACAALAMLYSPLQRQGAARPRIAVPTQLVFAAVMAGYVAVLAVVGGAVLARYLLPVYPLVVIICVSTLWRRVPWWPVIVGVTAVAFVAGLFVQPPYRIAPEDNLTYSDFVYLHKEAAAVLAGHGTARVLTAWPATDELSRPYLGYVMRPVPVIGIENFSMPQLMLAAQERERYDYALLFSTKYEPPHPLFAGGWWERMQQRYFDYHRDLPPQVAAEMLGGRIVMHQRRGAEWVAIVQLQRVQNASFYKLTANR